jgi:hypothetical protein
MRRSTPTIPTPFVEVTTLPRIMVKTRGGGARYAAYVNGYIVGPKCRYKGISVTPIYSLSLVGMSGEGGKLQGIWSALVSNPAQDVYLETVGTVVLAHRDPQFERLGYTIHWNYNQWNDRDTLHGVVESNMLTICDPTVGIAPLRRERKKPPQKAHHNRKAHTNKVQLTTATKKELGDMEERINREKRPLFMLMVPGNVSLDQSTYLAELHYAFLDLRVPQPMSREWADFLWQRAVAALENTQLTIWFSDVVQGEQEEKKIPLIREAWLCRPNITRLDADRRLAQLEGRISSLHEQVPALP